LETGTLFFLSFPFFLYLIFSSFFSIVTFLGWTRLHATWIKPEVVATKKYTGYLHYHNTGTCFSVSSDDKLVPFLFPGIPTGDPAIVAFYDTKDKFKFGAKLISDNIYVPEWFLFLYFKYWYFREETEKQVPVLCRCPCWQIPESPLSDFLLTNFSHPEYDWNIACWTLSNQ
jgi:hypothetical protein